VPLLDNSKELLTLKNNTIMDIRTPILTVVSIDFINTHYQTLRSEHCVKQVLRPFLGGRESILKVGLKAGLYYRSQVLGRKRKYIDKGFSLNIHIVLAISIASDY